MQSRCATFRIWRFATLIQPIGVVVLGSEGALSPVRRQLWCVDGAMELGYGSVGLRGLAAIGARSAGLIEAAGANSYCHCPRHMEKGRLTGPRPRQEAQSWHTDIA